MRSPLLLALGLVALSAAPLLASAPPSEDAVKAVVVTFAKSWESGDLAAFESTLDDKLLWAHPGGTLDKAGAIIFFKKWKKEWSNTRIYPTQFIVEGNRVLAEYQFCATNIATGKREAKGTAAIGEIKDGKLVEEYYDLPSARSRQRGTSRSTRAPLRTRIRSRPRTAGSAARRPSRIGRRLTGKALASPPGVRETLGRL